MAKLSKRRLLIEACTACFEPRETKSRKYVAFYRADISRIYYIGKSAALRSGLIGNSIVNSASLTGNRVYRALLVVGQRAADDCYSSQQQARDDLAAISQEGNSK